MCHSLDPSTSHPYPVPTTLFRVVLALSAVIANPSGLSSQTPQLIPFLDTPVQIDGQVGEEEWAKIEPIPVVMFAPEYGGEMTERTEIRFAHDGENLYASAHFFDSEPQGIRANALTRDDDAEDDFFNVVIDTFRDGESAVWFLVTPRGNRVDGAITDNAEGEGWNHVEYDSFWEAAATIDEEGWSAEMRIPFSTLRFNLGPDGAVRMALIAGRYISRKGERHIFPPIRPGPAVAQYKPSLAAPVVLQGVQPGRPLHLRPYALGGIKSHSDGSKRWNETVREIGADLKIGLSNDITVDLTLNTDFAQTEVDDQRVNLTRYDLLFPEKRSFFLERSGTFSLDAGPSVRLFHSRAIGLDESGNPLRVYGGARAVGRVGSWDFGLLNMHTDDAVGSSGTNSGVLRLRRDVLGSQSYVGGILTTTYSPGRGFNLTLGIDGLVRILGDEVALTAGATPAQADEGIAAESVVRVLWERRNHRAWRYRGEFMRIGKSFSPPLGFVAAKGLTTAGGAVGYGWFGGRMLQASRLEFDGTVSWRHADQGVEAARLGVAWHAERRGGGVLQANLAWRHEGLLRPFELGTVTVPPGSYDFLEAGISAEAPRGQRLRGALSLGGGEFFDGYRATGTATPTWAVSPFIELGGRLEANRVWFATRNRAYKAVVSQLRTRVSPNRQLSIHGLLQHNTAASGLAANVRLRYTIEDGSDIYLVFTSSSIDSTGELGENVHRTPQSLLLKYTATLR